MKRFWCYALPLLGLLSGCGRLPELTGDPDTELAFSICEAALAEPLEKRAYQGLAGWFFFTLDLKETYPLYDQTAFFVDLSARLEAQGVSLLLVPVTGRALVRPDTLFLGDPLQIGFSPLEAEAVYRSFLAALRGGGVQVFDTLAAARAYDAAGGQTFFSRDLHWRSEGAKAVFEGVAAQIEVFAPGLPNLALTLRRSPDEVRHYGQFVNNWTARDCGYRLPPEPHGAYSVTPSSTGGSQADVVLVGSSFSIPPYGYDFLATALQSPVLNVAVGSGGAAVSLRRYLGGDAYRAQRPRVLVWEFPVYAPELTSAEQAELLRLVE